MSTKRKPNRSEMTILVGIADLVGRSASHFHGYELVKHLDLTGGRAAAMNHGTVYRGLRRLEEMGFVESEWETPTGSGRPKRNYSLTSLGRQGAIAARASLDAEGARREAEELWEALPAT